MQKIFVVVIISFLGGILGAWFFATQLDVPEKNLPNQEWQENLGFRTSSVEERPDERVKTTDKRLDKVPDSFVDASEKSTGSVVFIKNFSGTDSRRYSIFDYFFGQGVPQQTVSTGSGVIFSEDGYIITNNHVVARAETIEVVHKKRTYKASMVGADANTDIAVLKIEAKGLPAIKIGSSRSLQIGEWVLAVGNPFNLTSTVTAGIVSAKERQINIMGGEFPLESFIQTDAPINPGNSGGALVNVNGELVGINTAILSRTGSYTGYGFAVPVDIATKIANDLIRFGEVQKAIPGLEVQEITPELAEEMNLKSLDGVVVSHIIRNGAADRSGIRLNDVIVGIDGNPISGKGSFEEALSYYYPGDRVKVAYLRDNVRQESELTLQNLLGGTGVIKKSFYSSPLLGAKLESINTIEMDRFGLEYGVKITGLTRGYLRDLGMGEGFILTQINNRAAEDPEEVGQYLEAFSGRLKIEGMTAGGRPFVQEYTIQ
ncbi:S1C family serine protease [Cyclobacterium jeungdonense]|uniref:Trypsin-like peptidase domain-containing protein n=1 Tax=Cyclobacterium jeungdonense TaxID=708087 RepID=A0ABT8C3C1_9BACT|nr:trypsin-like peptidase domain-containing protein [Cyclobacterium jeungdonense]MDN3686811.1 trypsin-like peptidase domain-containing protein [Cyclobacterium jeungdonense]